MVGSGHVLIAGASGVIGRAAAECFAARGWTVTALSRRNPGLGAKVRYHPVNLLDATACAAVPHLETVTHLVYAAVFEEDDLVSGWRSERQMEINLTMLRNVVGPLTTGGNMRHVSLFQGTKAYGVHIRPFPVPARESWPRHQHRNFYWLQEDFIRKAGGVSNFAWTIWRPQVVFGDVCGAAMNALPVLGALAAMEAAAGRDFGYPGGPDYVLEAVDARLIANALYWAAMSPSARDEIFNITNGDVFVWRNVWPTLAKAFGLRAGDERPQRLSQTMPKRAGEWAAIARRFGLACRGLGELMGRSHHYADFVMATAATRAPPPVIVSTLKLREAGFSDCIDTETMFTELIQRLQERRILPDRQQMNELRRMS
ncbi:NAD-dependent epimerase/dehydratase family protein [Paracoccus sediminicola]|uniref:NAD-dependent epimerase/dehydratase family protein n=1 Tax=Paracoccus sediminicola TaxID=3017783 RepID=UPI0022F03D6F|nr:NAD-dependent epimerase/dehydratase family protein [Paracoccus sediminicola]WBU56229.1 NAD-dependent epimerase/dehydratase family protein [Paracoccus sediminicola]